MTVGRISGSILQTQYGRAETLKLVALPDAVGPARAYCAATLRGWGYTDPDFLFNAGLVVSELVTNALEATTLHDPPEAMGHLLEEGALVRLTLTVLADLLFIEVWDRVLRPPRPRCDVPDDATRGRGLRIVADLACQWSYRYSEGPCGPYGKTVFAVLPVPIRQIEASKYLDL
ncbi:ATP-binding protein [Spongiactinospora gelatinilytica]|nr:ATP-binding protein [Spongiactinospora gelatinilytica]